MPPALWSGTVSFGLVAIPVTMVTAVRENRVAFHLLHDADHARLERQMRCVEEDTAIDNEHLIRGAEIAPGQFIPLTDEELAGLAPTRTRNIDVELFVDIDTIPPILYERPYYLLPNGVDKPYRLLVDVLRENNRMAIARFVLHTREHLVGLRALGEHLVVQMLHFEQELHSLAELEVALPDADRGEVRKIGELIEKLTGPFQPEQFEDAYVERVQAFVEERRQAGEIVEVPGETAEEVEETPDLMEALEESMERARERRRHAA